MTSSSWLEWTARLRAYVGWLNSQLRKEEGCRRVSDLRNDLRDGVILSHLVASLGGDTVPGIEPSPRTEAQAKENVDRLFRFLIRKGVSIHSLTPKEVCDGDLKAIMRLVHAVASHYKPDTVLNPPKTLQRKEETKVVKKSCKVAPLQKCTSNLEPQKRNSKSEPASLDGYCRLSERFIEQLLNDVQQAKNQLVILQETLLNGRKESGGPQEKSSNIHGEKLNGLDINYEHLQEENAKLKKEVEEKEEEISKLKLSLCTPQGKNFKGPYIVPARIQREELSVVAEALSSLRHCFPANDARQHTLDTIDQSLAALLERINALEMASPSLMMTNSSVRRLQDTPPHSCLKSSESALQPIGDNNGTKVVYYMDKSLTPFRCTLHKRIGEATLRDFKLLFDRPGQYRYHFKTLDPEFGMVKEEVFHDDDVLPAWDSKLVAWIEEECS